MHRYTRTRIVALASTLLLFTACGDDDDTNPECGDGVVEGGEECDSSDLDGNDCTTVGGDFVSGALACADGCTFDTSGCNATAECGNETAEGDEVCDGADLQGEDCAGQGFDDGTLACASDCSAFDTSGCIDHVCGDDAAEGSEVCDGADLVGQDCTDQGFADGTLACASDCSAFDTSGCIDHVCGDDVAQSIEVCDGADLLGQTCADHGFLSGNLACNATCDGFDTSGCDNSGATCGNGVQEGLESCDGADIFITDCTIFGYDSGTITCNANCQLDYNGCVGLHCSSGSYSNGRCDPCVYWGELPDAECYGECFVSDGYCGAIVYGSLGTTACQYLFGVEDPDCGFCGDGVVQGTGGEQCDGHDYHGYDCQFFGFTGGTLACDPSCRFDVTGCTGAAVCGDGVVNSAERCDGNTQLLSPCRYEGDYASGHVTCDANCQYDFSACVPSTCGDGVATGGEQCDGDDLAWSSCMVLGFDSGTLACDSNCELDTSGCVPYICGNLIVDPGEQCDSLNLLAHDCTTLGQGYAGGTLACDANCQLDTSGCTPAVCGDGVRNGLEICEGADLSPHTCANIGHGFVGGSLACSANCTFDTTACTLPTCGDGAIAGHEQCDGANLGGYDCPLADSHYVGGALACDPGTCRFDLSGCVEPTCGDGVIEGSERCEGADTGGYTCANQGFSGGTLACHADCFSFDTSGCIPHTCGDGVQYYNEVCDGADLGWQDCSSLGMGFSGGVLACLPDCTGYDTSGCTAPTCGNGVQEWPVEDCDGADPTSTYQCDWIDESFVGGTPACNADCTWDLSGCQLPTCGDGVAETIERCDGADVRGHDCSTLGLGFGPGTLTCNASCNGYDISACPAPVCGNGTLYGTEECDDGNLTPGDGCDPNCAAEPTAIAGPGSGFGLAGSLGFGDTIWAPPSIDCFLIDITNWQYYDLHVIQNFSAVQQTITLTAQFQPWSNGKVMLYNRPWHPSLVQTCIQGAGAFDGPVEINGYVMQPGEVLLIVVSSSWYDPGSEPVEVGPYTIDVYTH